MRVYGSRNRHQRAHGSAVSNLAIPAHALFTYGCLLQVAPPFIPDRSINAASQDAIGAFESIRVRVMLCSLLCALLWYPAVAHAMLLLRSAWHLSLRTTPSLKVGPV
jgi:hypothetical protein